MSPEYFKQLDQFFSPYAAAGFAGQTKIENVTPISKLFYNSMKETEKITDTRMFENVVVVGGNTLTNGFIGKMSELAAGPLQDVKVRVFC